MPPFPEDTATYSGNPKDSRAATSRSLRRGIEGTGFEQRRHTKRIETREEMVTAISHQGNA